MKSPALRASEVSTYYAENIEMTFEKISYSVYSLLRRVLDRFCQIDTSQCVVCLSPQSQTYGTM